MKIYLIKMMCIILVLSSFVIKYKEKKVEISNSVVNNVALKSDTTYNDYEEIIYDGYTISEIAERIDSVMGSTLTGYGDFIASYAIEKEVDPLLAASIILHETGCMWECSYLTKTKNNVGGMRGSNGYMSFNTLEEGIIAFINNLAYNYYAYGLTTPEAINKKYAENSNWASHINYYINLMKAS